MSLISKQLYFIIWCFSLQLIILGTNLAHDEAYYWLYSKSLDWGYFDHPPLIAWLISLGSFFPDEWGVRLFPSLLLTWGFWILAKDLNQTSNRQWWAFLLASPLISISASLALPDTALLLMICFYLIALKNFLQDDGDIKNKLFLALSIVGMLNAKYHGILLIFFTIVAHPKFLTQKSFWQVTGLSLLGFLPHILWQLHHDFVTFRYHFLDRPKAHFSLKSSLEFLGVQFLLPALWCGFLTWKQTLKSLKNPTDHFDRILSWMSIGITIFFLIAGFSKKIEANWTIMVSLILGYQFFRHGLIFPSRLLNSAMIVVLIAKLYLVIAPSFPLKTAKRLGEFHGWKEWSLGIQKKHSCTIVANTYQLASKLSFYLPKQPLVWAMNLHSRKNQFDLWRPQMNLPDKFCFISDKNYWEGEKIQTPDHKQLILVPELTLNDIMAKRAL
jgi:4-amino-4-deoxy-L-arabinose transferase-like glycosyltransferase